MPAKKPVASVTVPPVKPVAVAKKPAVKKAPVKAPAAKPVAKAPAKKPAAKAVVKPAPVQLSDELIKKLQAEFAKGAVKRDADARGSISRAQKVLLVKEAKKLGMTPSALVAAIITAWLQNR